MNQLRAIAVALVVVAGGSAWGIMIMHRGYDYDEVLRAHSVWMTSEGLRPYHDFFECHPPYFGFLAPLARTQRDPGALLAGLRWMAAGGNLLFLTGLATAAGIWGGAGRLAAILGTALVAFHPAVLRFLAEFRVDGWGYALAIWSIVWFLNSRGTRRGIWFGVGTGTATLFFCPKLALLPPMIVALDQVRAGCSWKGAVRAFAHYFAGVSAAAGLFYAWLMANGIGIDRVWACLVRYNSLYNSHSGYGHGLLRTITQIPELSVPLLIGLVVWAACCLRARALPASYPAALALWLCAQAIVVAYPYKQYYAPWFLFASGFFPFLRRILKEVPRGAVAGIFFGLCALSIAASVATAYTWSKSTELRDHTAFLRKLNELTDPGDRIVAAPNVHPIFRRDTFYVWFKTYDPAGYETEQVLEGLPLLRELVSEGHYREELKAQPPAVVVFSDLDPARQRAVVTEFVQEHRYVSKEIGGVSVAVRPDRAERWGRIQD